MQIQLRNILEIIDAAVKDHPLGIKGIAAELDKSPSQLYGELNPYANGLMSDPDSGGTRKAKMGLGDFLTLIGITECYAALEATVAVHGYTLQKIKAEPANENTAYPALSHAMSTLGELASALKKDMGDNRLTPREKLDLFSKAVDAYDSLGPFLALGATSQNRTK